MPKRNAQKELHRLFMAGLAKKHQKDRLDAEIANNKELQKELESLRKKYKFRKKDFGNKPWVPYQSDETLVNLANEVDAIEKKYSVSVARKIYGEVWNLPDIDREEIFRKMGKLLPGDHLVTSSMPVIQYTLEGEELIISPETDIRNEEVIKYIEAWQKETLKKINPPPQPQRSKNSTRLDWRPLWEWRYTHRQFSIKEIAEILGRPYTRVKSNLERLDKETGFFSSKSNMQ